MKNERKSIIEIVNKTLATTHLDSEYCTLKDIESALQNALKT